MVQGFEMVRDQPAWHKMRNMRIDPREAVLADGTIMSGNQFRRNIACYREPKAKYVSCRNFSPEHNAFDSNLVWHHGDPVLTGYRKPGRDSSGKLAPKPGLPKTPDDWQAWQTAGMDRHSLIADPRFVAAGKDDYRLQPDSPAWKLGFQAIPVEKIGPYQDSQRASWPIVEAEGAREKPLISQ